jgi:GrpB-like predicted nucleotidyltransferase (UPF0157 family)
MHNILEKALKEKYVFKPYSSDFPKIFQEEKEFLESALIDIKQKEIHHIGSTSVPGLGGKGIIDIIIVVDKLDFERAHDAVLLAGFTFDHTLDKKRSFLYKYYVDSKNNARLIHLHITFFGSGEIEKALSFREHLRSHEHARKEYEELKKKGSELHSDSAKDYKKHKFDYISKKVSELIKSKEKEN